MQRPPTSPLEADVAAALSWWRGAGVDAVFADEPSAWLADPEAEIPAQEVLRTKAPAAKPVVSEPSIGGEQASWPQDLDAFRSWWLSQPSLDEGGLSPRVAPTGEAGADLMILVAMPEEADRDSLLSGPEGQLLEGFLAAAGIATDKVYRASVLPRHTPLADWAQIERQGMGALLAHHVRIARPTRLLVLGRNILPLCGHDPAQGTQKLRSFNHEGGRVPALFTFGLGRLYESWQARARLWKEWLEWTETDAWREAAD